MADQELLQEAKDALTRMALPRNETTEEWAERMAKLWFSDLDELGCVEDMYPWCELRIVNRVGTQTRKIYADGRCTEWEPI